MEKAQKPGQVKQSGIGGYSALPALHQLRRDCRAERFLVALTPAGDLFSSAKDLFVEVHGPHSAIATSFHSDRARPGRSEQSVLSFIASRSSFLIGELLLGKLSEAVVVVGNAPHDRPGFLVSHLIGNRASFLCTKAPMLRIPETNFLQGITSISGRDVQAIFSAAATSR